MTTQNNALPTARKPLDMRALLDNWAMLLAAVGIFVLCALLIDNSPFAAEHARAGPGGVHRGHRGVHHAVLPGIRGISTCPVGSVIACAGVVAAIVIPPRDTDSVMLGIGAALGMGLIVGLINGIVIAKLRVNALITTLATMQIVRGLAYIFADGKAVGVSQDQFFIFGNGQLFGVPVPILITILCFLFFGWLLNYTTYGRNTMAIGGNPEAALLAGVNVDRTKILIFAVHGLIGALAGVILASRMTSRPADDRPGLRADGDLGVRAGRCVVERRGRHDPPCDCRGTDPGDHRERDEPEEHRHVLSVRDPWFDPVAGGGHRPHETTLKTGL